MRTAVKILTIVAWVVSSATSMAKPPAGPRGPIVDTTSGQLEGLNAGPVNEFLGVPYAAPPIGSLRFSPPTPPAAWNGSRAAQSFGSPCAQPASLFGVASSNEDCLYLNIYTPARSSGDLPVMVWIHGGSYVSGEGSDYDGTALVAQGNVIVVTINYRLGPFGFLTAPALDALSPSGSSGNYGLMDQQAAFAWVKQNAAAFGGDPNRITLFGESAGGQAIVDHLASPTAAGLFNGAIIESGGYEPVVPSLATAEATDAPVLTQVGCTAPVTAACLLALPTSAYLAVEAAEAATAILSSPSYYGPVLASPILPQQPLAAITAGNYNAVPVINGSNHDEARVFIGAIYDLSGAPLQAAQYGPAIDAVLGTELGTLTQTQYPLILYPSPDDAFSAVATDVVYSCSAQLLDNALSLHAPLYAYEFSAQNAQMLFVPLAPTFPYLDSHTTELGYLWPELKGFTTGETESFSPAQAALSAAMISEWTEFAHTYSPNGAGLPVWQSYLPSLTLESLVTPAPVQMSALTFTAAHKCAYWLPLLTTDVLLPTLGL